jgi:hypothetical protein
VDTTKNGVTRLAHISITTTLSTNANAPASGLLLANYENATTYVSNSVVWGNDPEAVTKDIYASGPNHFFTRVHYGKLGGSVLAGNVTPGTGDPGFVGVGNPHLRSDSILIDSGVANPEGGSGTYDADGAARVQGVAVDVGHSNRT